MGLSWEQRQEAEGEGLIGLSRAGTVPRESFVWLSIWGSIPGILYSLLLVVSMRQDGWWEGVSLGVSLGIALGASVRVLHQCHWRPHPWV